MEDPMIGWEAGSSAQLEVFSPRSGPSPDVYQFRYTPPFRTTIRPPSMELMLDSPEMNGLKDAMNRLGSARRARGSVAIQDGGNLDVSTEAKRIGQMLFEIVIPRDVQADLRTENLFLEIGADEGLLEYPWELLHDGDEYLSIKHYVGRYVNVTKSSSVLAQQRRERWNDDTLRVLLISVPRPLPRAAGTYDPLVFAELETQAIFDTLAPLGAAVETTVLKDADASFNNVFQIVRDTRFHIVHFVGHASFSDEANKSSIALWDKDMSPSIVRAFFARNPPVLFVMNACQTAATASGVEWENSYEIFGLARGFLETGAYLLGTRWKVDDEAALAFAKTFYFKLLEGKPLGMAIRDARAACKASRAEDLSWASYLFYGDPRLYFRKRS